MKTHLHSLLQLFALVALLCTGDVLRAQSVAVTGRVLDANGEGIPGVNILEQGSNNGTITDVEGHFSLNVNANATLVLSAVGYLAQEIALAGRATLDVTLQEDVKALEEVVVVGYGTTTRQNITTSVAKVDPKNIPTPANNSIPELLFGRAAGLQVTQQSSEPGGNINLSIRGRGNPLVVVDGVVFPYSGLEPDNGGLELQGVQRGGLAGLNPNDIESIEVLKDASAAIYGVNAANGVILITTKKGKAGRMNVNYSGSRSLVTNLPYLEPLNAQEYMRNYNQFTLDKYLADNQMQPFGPNAATGFQPKYSETDIQNAGEGTDWLGEVLRNGSIDNHTLGITGGSERATYYFSGSYFNQVGTMKNSDLTRYNGRLNVAFQLNKRLTFNTSVNASRNYYGNSTAGWQTGNAGTQSFGALQAALAYPSSVPVRDADGNFTQFAVIGNPVSLLNINDQTMFTGLLANLSLDVDIIPGMLTGKVLYGNNSENSVRDFFIPSTVFWGQLFRARGSLNEARRQNQTMEATLSFKKSLGAIASVDAVGGVGQYIEDGTGFGIEASDMLDVINTTNLASATGPKTTTSYKYFEKKRSFFGRASFDVLDRYLLTLTYRYDGYDKFFPNQKYAGFPSASVGWKLSNESFLKNNTTLNLLKLRASMGTTGNTIGSVAYGVFVPDPNIIVFNNGGVVYTPYYQTALDQPNLKWQKTVNSNIGLDFGLFRDRISGSLDWFHDDITNLLNANANTPQLSYISSVPRNGGRTIRQGVELAVSTANVRSDVFEWNSTLNISHYYYHWVRRFENNDLQPYVQVDDPVNAIYVFETDGILQPNQEIPEWQPEGARMAGAPRFVDRNGDNTLDYQDVVRYNADPRFILGFGNSFRYRNFDLNVFLYGQRGATGWNYTSIWADPNNLISGNQSGTDALGRVWSTANPDGTWPGVSYNETTLGLPASVDTRLARRDFLRCRNLTLGYNVDPGSERKYFQSLRVYVDVQNAFLITKYEGADPETQAANVKGGPAPYPMARTYSLGVKASF
ncbi:TonB-linked outer membrane protein, SusC/RagA family [Catalinimonas alkaloidigena]|uniref:TonB-linked outer membrane protein, SusC/RagA family n=1 Tax=Catalinimonas alkaloidigena TaxID=1075417 RepID=A0A1G9GZX2_9BACT|nr:SusC/RagA family TonB-linked outer membrane protein [Catalinimonas alkaloidigena]SDL06217.1 TonB-linked outer membrane protein, SusC/RagA family [Catalinimonas alkaloidigena]